MYLCHLQLCTSHFAPFWFTEIATQYYVQNTHYMHTMAQLPCICNAYDTWNWITAISIEMVNTVHRPSILYIRLINSLLIWWHNPTLIQPYFVELKMSEFRFSFSSYLKTLLYFSLLSLLCKSRPPCVGFLVVEVTSN